MKPFKRPRLANTPGNADTTDAPMFAKPYASIPAPSRQGSAVGRSVSSKSENTGSHATTSTFSGIASPPRAIHDRALNELGQVTQPLKEPVRFRKQAGTDEDIGFVFRHTFHKQHYKGRQEDIMKASLRGSDILVIAPTGMGKSMCFQVPAVAEKHGMTLVVSPLLSLMQDQISALRQLDVPCAMLSSKTSREEQKAILHDMTSGHPQNRLLYITPERLSSAPFCKKLKILHKQQEFNRLVVDEAHCISEWGHDFRPEYAKLGNFRCEFPKVPIMALTASATPKVQEDIANDLGLEPDLLFKVIHPFNRPNLFYEIRYYSEREDDPCYRQNDVLSFIQKTTSRGGPDRPCAGIVYCRAKKTCDDLAAFLRGKGVFAAPYHRGLKDHEADANQQKWVANDMLAENGSPRVDCIVATVAMGMGIDKSNCRYIVHYDIPKSFEGYYQETGRAGRDGHAARCVLYYSSEDKLRIKELVRKTHSMRERRHDRGVAAMPSQRAPNSLEALLSYCENVKVCRHVTICRYFGEKIQPEDASRYCDRLCDVCRDPAKARRRRDASLAELDFAATQAVARDVEECDVDPDDFYEDGRRRIEQLSDVEEGAEDDDDDSDTAPRKVQREGFRTAAVQHEREKGGLEAADTSNDQEQSPSPAAGDVVEQEEYFAPLKGGDDSDDGSDGERYRMEVVELSDDDGVKVDKGKQKAPQHGLPTVDVADSADEEEEAVPPPADVPRQPSARPAAVTVDSGDSEAEEEVPDLASRFKENLPLSKPTGPAAGPYTGLVRTNSGVQVMGTLPQPNIIRAEGSFTTPFSDPSRHPKYKDDQSLKKAGEAASSVGDDPPKVVNLEPALYDKKIPTKMRKDAVVHLVKYLQRAFLSKHGRRSSNSEERVWKDLSAGESTHDQRRAIILAACVEVESDLFWTSTTHIGYRSFLKSRSAAAKSLVSDSDPLPQDGLAGNEAVDVIIKALRRAVSVVLPKRKSSKRKAVAAVVEADGSASE